MSHVPIMLAGIISCTAAAVLSGCVTQGASLHAAGASALHSMHAFPCMSLNTDAKPSMKVCESKQLHLILCTFKRASGTLSAIACMVSVPTAR